MEVFFHFCNICHKIDGSLKDISEDNLKHLKDTLIALVGNADIIKHNEIYLCKLCCEELIRFDKFKEKCFNNLIQLRQTYLNMLSKLELKDDMATAKNTLKKYVHEQILPRNSLGINNCPVSIPTEYGIVKLSEHFNKNDAVFNRQVINLQSERNESECVSDCKAVSVINTATEYDESQVALTNEQVMKNEIRCSEYTEFEAFDRKFHEDFQASNINNANVNNTSHIQFIKEEVDLDNEIESSDSENVTLPNFEHIDVDVNVSAVNNGEETVNSTKDELHVKQESSRGKSPSTGCLPVLDITKTFEMAPHKIRGKWSEISMKEAIKRVIDEGMSLREAAFNFSVPKSTLADKIQQLRLGREAIMSVQMGRFRKTFSDELESQIVVHLKDLDSTMMPISRREFLKIVYDLAEHLKVPHQFNKTKKTAGKKFYYEFMSRHPEFSLRCPQSTSIQRATRFNKEKAVYT